MFLFPNNSPQNLDEILKSASPLAVDMIKSMLNYDSSKRPTAAKLLQHPYFGQQNGGSISEIAPLISMSSQMPNQHKALDVDPKPSNPLNSISNNTFGNQQNAHPNSLQSGLGNLQTNKAFSLARNLMSELENNWQENSHSSKKLHPRVEASPLPKQSVGSPTDKKSGAFGDGMDFDDRHFQQKLESMFPQSLRPTAHPQLQPAILLNSKKTFLADENTEKTNYTAKKKQFDADLEELERQILVTKKKFNSPGKLGKGWQNSVQNTQPFEESAISRKKGSIYNQMTHENSGKAAGKSTGNPVMFNDQLEELLCREQRIMEQRTMKVVDGKLTDAQSGRLNVLRTRNSIYDGLNGSANINSSDTARFKNNSNMKGLAENSLGDLECLPKPLFMINGFQTAKHGVDALKTQHCVVQKL